MLYLLREGQEKALPLEASNQGFTEGEVRTLINCLPELLGEDLFILNYDFDGFSPSGNRAGILALSRTGGKLIVELRQGEADATELKALEYAATYSKATVADLAEVYAQGNLHNGSKPSPEAALAEIQQYLEESDSPNGHDSDPAIVVFASGFRPEFHTTANWLKGLGVNISCVRFRGYHVDDSWVIDVEHDSPFVMRQEPSAEVKRAPAEPRRTTPVPEKKAPKAEVAAEPIAEVEVEEEFLPEDPQPSQDDDSALRYPLLSKVKQLLAHWRPEMAVVAHPDALVFPSTQDNAYFAISVHIHPEPTIEVGLHVETESLELNRAVAKHVLQKQASIEEALGEKLDVQDPWYRSWVRLSVRRSYDPYSTTQAAEAAETAAEFVDVLTPHLTQALAQTPGIGSGPVAKSA